MTQPATLRDRLVERLTEEFGAPISRANNFRWSIDMGPSHPCINIALDCWRTPESLRLWIFDPSGGSNGVHSMPLTTDADIEPVLIEIEKRINKHNCH